MNIRKYFSQDNPQINLLGKHSIAAIDLAVQIADGPCWLCAGLGGVALHEQWTVKRGKSLFTAHEYPSDDPHETRPCPVCRPGHL